VTGAIWVWSDSHVYDDRSFCQVLSSSLKTISDSMFGEDLAAACFAYQVTTTLKKAIVEGRKWSHRPRIRQSFSGKREMIVFSSLTANFRSFIASRCEDNATKINLT